MAEDPVAPISVEYWLDFIIASSAHRSHNSGQRQFGNMLIQRYFSRLPDRYSKDPTATVYFDNMLCSVAASVRGFSVVRDTFQTNWDMLESSRKDAKKTADDLRLFSPFASQGTWGKVLAVITGIGLTPALKSALIANKYPMNTLLIGVVSVVVCLFGIHALVEWFRYQQFRRVDRRFPNELQELWERQSLESYRIILEQFLLLSIDITRQHYPKTPLPAGTPMTLVERHLASFGFRDKLRQGDDAKADIG